MTAATSKEIRAAIAAELDQRERLAELAKAKRQVAKHDRTIKGLEALAEQESQAPAAGDTIPFAQLAAMTPEQLASLKANSPDVYRKSIEASCR